MEEHMEFNAFQEETKIKLIELEQATDNSRLKSLVKKLAEELESLFEQTKKFIEEHNDPERNRQMIEKLKDTTDLALETMSKKVKEFKEDDKVQDILEVVQGKCKEMANYVNDCDTFNKVKDNVSDTFTNVKNDENIKKNVKKAKTTTLNLAKKALEKIEKALDDDGVVIHTMNQENTED